MTKDKDDLQLEKEKSQEALTFEKYTKIWADTAQLVSELKHQIPTEHSKFSPPRKTRRKAHRAPAAPESKAKN